MIVRLDLDAFDFMVLGSIICISFFGFIIEAHRLINATLLARPRWVPFIRMFYMLLFLSPFVFIAVTSFYLE